LKPRIADISAVASTEVDPGILCEILSQVDGVISVSIIDRYLGSPIKPGFVGLTFRVNIVGDAEVESIVTKARTILKRLGCKMREEYIRRE
jgi:ferredoxin-fold anticodon binding domain-containing protein